MAKPAGAKVAEAKVAEGKVAEDKVAGGRVVVAAAVSGRGPAATASAQPAARQFPTSKACLATTPSARIAGRP